LARYSGALQTRDRQGLGACDDPGSAVHRFALHRIREKNVPRSRANRICAISASSAPVRLRYAAACDFLARPVMQAPTREEKTHD
jgi:hypothetical protein